MKKHSQQKIKMHRQTNFSAFSVCFKIFKALQV